MFLSTGKKLTNKYFKPVIYKQSNNEPTSIFFSSTVSKIKILEKKADLTNDKCNYLPCWTYLLADSGDDLIALIGCEFDHLCHFMLFTMVIFEHLFCSVKFLWQRGGHVLLLCFLDQFINLQHRRFTFFTTGKLGLSRFWENHNVKVEWSYEEQQTDKALHSTQPKNIGTFYEPRQKFDHTRQFFYDFAKHIFKQSSMKNQSQVLFLLSWL